MQVADAMTPSTVEGAPFAIRRPTFEEPPGSLGRLGLLVLANDIVIESEIRRMLGDLDVGLHVSRLAMPAFGTVEALGALRDHMAPAVAHLVPRNRLDAIGFGCTSASAIIGDGNIAGIVRGARGSDIPCTNPIAAAANALRRLRARRVALVSPYPAPILAHTLRYLGQAGLGIEKAVSFDTVGDENISRIGFGDIRAGVNEACAAGCDAVFVSCTALRVVARIGELEAEFGKPVVTSNQALLAEMLALARSPARPPGFGAAFGS